MLITFRYQTYCAIQNFFQSTKYRTLSFWNSHVQRLRTYAGEMPK
jgi:hypothetical protein